MYWSVILGPNKAIGYIDRTSRCRDTSSEVVNSCCLFLEGQMDAVETVGCIGWPGAPCTDSGEHDGGY